MAMKPRSRRNRSGPQRNWSAPRPSPSTAPRRRRLRSSNPGIPDQPKLRPEPSPRPEPSSSTLEAILDDFTRSWEQGSHPRAEEYVGLLSLEESAALIYHEFCLAEASDLDPDPADYLLRFPEQAASLGRLFALHGAVSTSTLRRWAGPGDLPSSGDAIGPYYLLRELGRGAFARVFLAEQTDLDHRLVVLKVSTRATAEPRLLARASHLHIVEVLRHAVANDGALHLVCMPFLGGATLAEVLEERRRRGRRARSGHDFLSDLDRVSAPEYPSIERARPTREFLARVSHAQALAWIVARLAEALDHAHQRGVAHGDLKPSNVLLTAEASPLLLDFNLSVDWRDAIPGESASERGGTLAYMAPERLDAIAEGDRDGIKKAGDLHRADLYALGLLLLEALTGRIPEVPPRRNGSPRDLARDLAGLRRTLPRSLRSKGIPPALRSIVARCLAPDPLDRYARGNELAEDLDRWRSDRPLIFATEPKRSEMTRQVRRRRVPLIVFGLTMSTALIASFVASLILQGTRRDQALDKYAMILDRPDSGAFGLHSGQWRPDVRGNPLEQAARQLSRYNVVNDPNWRARDDIQSLPQRERDELEVWLFEQILRYTAALGDTPESPDSWNRGLALLDRTLDRFWSEPLQAQRLVLLERLNQPDRHRFDPSVPRLAGWMDDYLAGVAAEPLHAREAMGHYLDALKERPELFWGHYRTGVVACRINEFDESAKHLRVCVARSPGNPVFHVGLAQVLHYGLIDGLHWDRQDPFAEALLECDRALKIDPDFAPAYSLRSWILKRTTLQTGSASADIHKFAVLSRNSIPASVMALRFQLLSPNFKLAEANLETASQLIELDPDKLETRTTLAKRLSKARRHAEAIQEFDRVLEENPDLLEARFLRAMEYRIVDPPAAIEEFTRLINNPRFEEIFTYQSRGLLAYHYVATDLMERGQIAEALAVAERCLLHVGRSKALSYETIAARIKTIQQASIAPEGQTLYLLAQIHAKASKLESIPEETRLDHRARALGYLKRVLPTNPLFRTKYYDKDRLFDDFRAEIDQSFGTPGPTD